jgi:hypothetical protein
VHFPQANAQQKEMRLKRTLQRRQTEKKVNPVFTDFPKVFIDRKCFPDDIVGFLVINSIRFSGSSSIHAGFDF